MKNTGITRRNFIKSSAAVTVLAGIGTSCSNLSETEEVVNDIEADTVSSASVQGEEYYNCCPRNCYDTCSVVTTVKDGVITYVAGNENNTYTDGKLCVKGYTYPRRIYSPDRIKYPMKQNGKGTGDWERISWDEAFEIIGKKIIEIQEKHGNTLPICLNKYSGNFNVLNYSIEGMISSFGHATYTQGSPCDPAGITAQTFDMGASTCPDPESLKESKLIILWGGNPAWTAVHSMRIVNEARENGAKVIVIDPIMTDTASRVDEYIEVKSSTDGALALGMCKYILDNNLQDDKWMEENSLGYQEFIDYVNSEITVEWASKETGVSVEIIEQLAHEYATTKPAAIFAGYGLQRHTNGGMTIRTLDALSALCGNINTLGGGVGYSQGISWAFNYNAMTECGTREDNVSEDRYINMNNFGEEALNLSEYPIELLWIACRNPLSQDPEEGKVKQVFENTDLVVTVDQFFTKSAEMSDIVLPVSTIFETWGIHASYWHYWINGNEPAIQPMFESKSDLEIAMGLSKKMNELKEGSSTFITDRSVEEWCSKELNDDILQKFGYTDWKQLFEKGTEKVTGYEVAWKDGNFKTPSGKYEFLSKTAEEMGHTALPKYFEPTKGDAEYNLRLITPHTKYSLHSQFQNIDWMMNIQSEPHIEINSKLASEYGIAQDDLVNVTSELDTIQIKAKVTENVPYNEVVIYEAWFKGNDFNVNKLVKAIPTDMGKYSSGQTSVSFHDTYVKISRA